MNEQNEVKGFDLKVHHKDKDGKILKETPYVMVLEGSEQRFYRGGFEFNPDGSRVNAAANAKKYSWDKGVSSEEADALLAEIKQKSEQAKAEIQAELDELRKEREEIAKERELLEKSKLESELITGEIPKNLESSEKKNQIKGR